MTPARPGPALPDLRHPSRRRRRSRVARGALLMSATALAAGAALTGPTLGWAWGALLGTPAALLGTALAAARLLGRRVVRVTVRGRSMEPGYHDGDQVLVERGATPSPGHVVVIERQAPEGQWRQPPLRPADGPGEVQGRHWIIKRVAAVPGDPVPRAAVPALATVPERHVPAGRLVLLGDNPQASLDSRQYGYFPAARVLGIVRASAVPESPLVNTPSQPGSSARR
ncbi:Signal peptidase, peptidase S26 [Streptomyces sp. 2224.1]|uniref:S26 family signal peptidase n=1 Tax=unclassified Streptomyces TaxID=2593676 RepID=UPI00089BC4D5|nr:MULTISPECIES: S26 family signal peptidase [unclassified Streptomyces]SED36013.1 Signal peptidase, peptidase S26 [Streptomyces sp. 2112.3]SED77476.1 Signal peptidase, peptidase S26 [Streptomyces sp. 2224.1]